MSRVTVIGAGVGGLSCAVRLAHAGFGAGVDPPLLVACRDDDRHPRALPRLERRAARPPAGEAYDHDGRGHGLHGGGGCAEAERHTRPVSGPG